MMAESPEHQYLSQTFLSSLGRLARSGLYTFREDERGKYDFSCLLAESWQCPLKGQTLWRHSAGIDKDLRTLLMTTDVPILAYVASDTMKHQSAFREAAQDYIRGGHGSPLGRLKVFWVPKDFDADSEADRSTVASLLRSQILEDILFNVIFGRLSPSRVHALLMQTDAGSLRMPGLDLALLKIIATDGFVSIGNLTQHVSASPATVRDRINRLQMSGLLLQERGGPRGYCAGPAGRAFLRLCAQVYRMTAGIEPLSPESMFILEKLGARAFEDQSAFLSAHSARLEIVSFTTPEALFDMMTMKAWCASQNWEVDWSQAEYRSDESEQDETRWLIF